MSVVCLRSVVCLLGRFPALTGIDLTVDEGEIVLLSGPNGAGKTTLLRVLAGLLPIHSGEAEVLGHDLALDRRSARRSLALVGHETGCYDDLTVAENLRFAARASGRGTDAVAPVLGRLGLERLAGVTHARLSAGQRRRLSLAAALVRDPELLLLDEPHAGLDADGRETLDAVLAAAPGEGRTVVLVSHELERARALADREVVISGGRVQPETPVRPETEVDPPAPVAAASPAEQPAVPDVSVAT
ncbi:MAG: heme exporter, ATP-binding protein CcmA [Actinomycetia bacterium]|nr:heme exporter, ATP-binding protein CcmA [Actinomycetes bacterium]